MDKVVKVNTVAGMIPASKLGKTLMHEHVMFGFGGWYANYTMTPFDREKSISTALNTMKKLKTCGINTVVDATPNDCARDAELLKEVSDKSGINIVCSTGLYAETEGAPGYFKFRNMVTGDATTEIYELFATEITQGIGTTGVRAGVIKVATSDGQITPYEEMVLKAAARAQKETGVPIITHTGGASTMGVEQADLFISEGLSPNRIVIGHIGGSGDIKYHLTLIGKGFYIAFDRLGLPMYGSDEMQKACIVGLIGIGHEKKILLSHDFVWYFLGKSPIDMSPTHIFEKIIPALKQAGVTDDKINTIMVENPQRLFAAE
jgi:phosphotriesterase-related protein